MAVFKREGSKFWQYEFEDGGRHRGSTGCTTKADAQAFEAKEREAVKAARAEASKGPRSLRRGACSGTRTNRGAPSRLFGGERAPRCWMAC